MEGVGGVPWGVTTQMAHRLTAGSTGFTPFGESTTGTAWTPTESNRRARPTESPKRSVGLKPDTSSMTSSVSMNSI